MVLLNKQIINKSLLAFFVFMFVFSSLFAGEVTDFQRLRLIKDVIKEKLDIGVKIQEDYLRQSVKPLLDNCMKEVGGRIDLKSEGGLSVMDFLTPEVGEHVNPYFDFCLWNYMAGSAFQDSPSEQRRETLYKLLQMSIDEKYEKFHVSIVGTILLYCIDSELYNGNVAEQINKLVEAMLLNKDKPWRRFQCILLLVRVEESSVSPSLIPLLKKEANKCKTFDDINSESIPFAATVVLASIGDKDDLRKFLNFMHDNGRLIGIRSIKYLFPFVTLIKKREIVLFLKEYLKSEEEMDFGDDVISRYEGHASIAAKALYIMLDGFPEPLDVCETRGHVTKEYRDKCLAFLSPEVKLNYRKKIDWRNINDYISIIHYFKFDL